MARYRTTIESRLAPSEAFAYMADFSNARFWDPSVSGATGPGRDGIGPDAVFDLVARFAGRDVPLRYRIVEFEAPGRVVLEAANTRFTSRDTITVEPAADGSLVHYDAVLEFHGVGRLLDPLMQRIFARVGRDATAGMKAALNP